MSDSRYIGAFDSGIGGISVLREMVKELPHENFLYYGDSANAPYGDRPTEEIVALTENVVKHLLDKNVKAIVIACNTSTSAAASVVRAEHPDIPILGIEPALKPAAKEHAGKKLLVMATAATLRLKKFQKLEHSLENQAQFIPLVCSGLADLVEKGEPDSPEMKAYLQKALGPYVGKVDGVILGCTHYPFVARQIEEVMGGGVPLFDGAAGTARQLHRRLTEEGLLNDQEGPGDVILESSLGTKEEIALYRKFLEMPE